MVEKYHILLLRNLVLTLGLVPVVALAATTEVDFLSIPALAYFVTVVTTMLGCLAGTLQRLSRHLEAGTQIRYPKLFVSSNILGGMVAGWLVFLLATHSQTPTLVVQGLVLTAAFGGSVVVERAIEKFFPIAKTQ